MAVQRAVQLGSMVLLLVFLEAPGLQACGRVAVESPIIHFGSTITATCTISHENCATIEGGGIPILWTLNDRKIPGSQSSSTKESHSNVTISRFDMPEGTLSCYATGNGTRQLIDRVHIRAGYPPSKPKDLSCVMNVTDVSLTCTWDPGQETNLETKVTLERYRNRGNECGDPQERKEDCMPEKGQNYCIIPRKLLNLYQKVDMRVTVQNALGSAKSESLCLIPMDVVKLGPPTIQNIGLCHNGCVTLNYTKPTDGSWIDQLFQLRYRPEQGEEWSTATNIPSSFSSPFLSTEQCGLRPGLNYQFQIRCIKYSLMGYWSDWSHVKAFFTPEGAPKGGLEFWWKALGSEAGTEVQLMWKRTEDAGGQVLRYLVSYSDRSPSEGEKVVCNTTAEQCNFLLPREISSVSVEAENSVARSRKTQVTLRYRTGPALAHVWAYPSDNHSLWAEWNASNAYVSGYILEWCRVTEEGPCDIQWKLESNTSSRSLLQAGIEPFKLFKVLVYPLYKDAVGLPVQTEAYSKEKAPSRSPKLHLNAVGKSHAELVWEPVSLEQRNGFITNYTIYWKDAHENTFFKVVSAFSRKFVMENLDPSSAYKVHLMSTTIGGSTNGTTLTLQTTLLDDIEISILCAACVLVLGLPFILYLKKHKGEWCMGVTVYKGEGCTWPRSKSAYLIYAFPEFNSVGFLPYGMKNRFWPNVPDPANSTSGKCIPANLQEIQSLVGKPLFTPACTSLPIIRFRHSGVIPYKVNMADRGTSEDAAVLARHVLRDNITYQSSQQSGAHLMFGLFLDYDLGFSPNIGSWPEVVGHMPW